MEGRIRHFQFDYAVYEPILRSFQGIARLNFGNRPFPAKNSIPSRSSQRGKCLRRRCGGTLKSANCRARSTEEFPAWTESAPKGAKTVYKDGFVDRMAINYLSKCLQDATGKSTDIDGYDGLIDVVSKTSQSFSALEQRKLVVLALKLAVPKLFLFLCRAVLRPSKFAWEYYAASTPYLFRWLVGPCEVSETENEGLKQKNAVHIMKCRFLESTNCVGMCLNLCKLPTQQFIAEELGAPLTMIPNFEDMSCDMVFGLHPPPVEEDPALKQPCYKLL